MLIFSGFVQAAEGSTFAVVPYVDPPCTGAVMGIVGAGGSAGAMVYSLMFREMDYNSAFNIMCVSIFVSAGLTCCIFIKEYASLLCGEIEEAETEVRCDVQYLGLKDRTPTPPAHLQLINEKEVMIP
eukprot:CAMPEP_0116554506 /NCGR_PEP_ID=MMETSP0397-20121206/7631_1 /TAXON_ID=216820 /ORGANISM="Cyclophora tenuis, Strain ECT3854" /LENGTH=126 /DNA_ID=CAMNT_0004079677 /DNA_START=147 /DNA_END=527 /DNA_ORIENTATION=+